MLRGPASVDVTATPEAPGYRFAVPGAQTADWLPGVYAYTIRATLGDDVHAVESGSITVLPDLASLPVGTETRTQNQRTLDAIDAVIEKRASQDQQRYVINNRELWRTPIADLLKLRALYVGLVSQDNAVARGGSRYGRSIRVRFTNPR